MKKERQTLVSSIREKCKVCYTCVRDCPAKAIRISQGQAQVIPERCIGCGNCVRVCTQNAKEVASSVDRVLRLLASGKPTAAIVAPSFPVAFDDYDHTVLTGALRALGFASVNEVAFGADLVARRYRRLLEQNPDRRYIATTCPALVSFVEYYHPDQVEHLAPLVSPMVATARALRAIHGARLRVVFVGPCIAKKNEFAKGQGTDGEIDAACTFVELETIMARRGIEPTAVTPSDFDEPRAGAGQLFPVTRGLLQAAKIADDVSTGDAVCADGRHDFVEAVKEFACGTMRTRLLEVLCCPGGCIMGSGIAKQNTHFQRHSRMVAYLRGRAGLKGPPEGVRVAAFDQLDLSRSFVRNDRRMPAPGCEQIDEVLARMGKHGPQDELNCGACGYETCRAHAVAIHNGLAESEMCLPYAIEQLKRTVGDLAASNAELASARDALTHSEKLATMGQLAAGIAHEVNNPLGVVLMYAHLIRERCAENDGMREDISMIVEEADRCKKIVSGLLNFARQSRIVRQPCDIRDVVERAVKAAHVPSRLRLSLVERLDNPVAEIDRDQLTQVLVNLLTNAEAAMPQGGAITVDMHDTDRELEVSVQDTGAGIPKENLSRIFDPFFTTKQIGQGTGLGLAVSYGIVKMHSGDIAVETNTDPDTGPTGSRFTVRLPRTGL